MISGAIAKVLVIDDEHIVAETLAIVFSNEGYETRAVRSAEAALALLETQEWIPQFVLIDVHLPGKNGIDFATTLHARYPEIPFLLFSGRAETAELLEENTKQGRSFDILAKPIHPTVLLGLVSSLLGEAGADGTPRHQRPN